VYQALALDWVDKGCGRPKDVMPRPVEIVDMARQRLLAGRLAMDDTDALEVTPPITPRPGTAR
jgi:hypothetical protein